MLIKIKHALRSITLALLSCVSFIVFAQDSLSERYSPDKNHHYRFFLKTEVLSPLLMATFTPGTYYFDLQASLKVSKHFHLVGTYGFGKYHSSYERESDSVSGHYEFVNLNGKAKNVSSIMLRYYPFSETYTVFDHFFVSAGYHYQTYKGSTYYQLVDTLAQEIVEQYEHHLNIIRHGPRFMIGLSPRFTRYRPQFEIDELPRVIVSPEISFGFNYINLGIIQDDLTVSIGPVRDYDYKEPLLRFQIKGKIGIAFR